MRVVYAECMNGIYTQPVTCSKDPKVPFAVTPLNASQFFYLHLNSLAEK